MKLLSSFILVLLVLYSIPSQACDCDSLYGLKESDFAFTGTVVKVVNDSARWIKVVTFDIDSVYKSLDSENFIKFTLNTPLISASCGYDFRLNERYIVFADYSEDQQEILSLMCHYSTPLGENMNPEEIIPKFMER